MNVFNTRGLRHLNREKSSWSPYRGFCIAFKEKEVELYLMAQTKFQDTLSEESRLQTNQCGGVFLLRRDPW